MPTQKQGFTLIELLIVIAIIGILASILFPVFAKAQSKAEQTTCLSNERQIGMALTEYIQDYDGVLPWTQGLSKNPGEMLGSGTNDYYGGDYAGRTDGVELVDLLYSYIKNKDVWFCPSTPRDVVAHLAPDTSWTYAKVGTSYQYNLYTGRMPPGYFPGHILGGTPLEDAVSVSNAPILWDDPCWGPDTLEPQLSLPHSEGVNAVMADGHVKWFAVPTGDMFCCSHGEEGWFY